MVGVGVTLDAMLHWYTSVVWYGILCDILVWYTNGMLHCHGTLMWYDMVYFFYTCTVWYTDGSRTETLDGMLPTLIAPPVH